MSPTERRRKYPDGRDEMNLADFPIAALQRQQPGDGEGRKRDRLEFEASRYDPATRQRVRQRVTLTSTAREGLPTPADDHVILALLYVAKHGDNFESDTVRFAPGQLFDIMGWAPNGRSYARLRAVLRRLKSLTVRYENAWWDAAGRGYEEEVATGIVSAYRIARQVSGPRTAATPLLSWVSWTRQFHDSLRKGNLKRLDLDVFFALQSPTAQRMYRFLDKRFYTSPVVAMDLVEFACGHVGLAGSDNVAVLKRRLAPAVAELEAIGFLAPADPEERYRKVRPGVWRVHFRAGPAAGAGRAGRDGPAPAGAEGPPAGVRESLPPPSADRPTEAAALAAEFYRRWDPAAPAAPGARDLEQAGELLRLHGPGEAAALIGCLVQVTRKGWPGCRSFSGAVQKYLADALALRRQQRRREEARQEAEARRRREQEQALARQEEERRRQAAWDALPEAEREAIRRGVRAGLGGAAPEAFVRRLCLEELARRQAPGASPEPGA
jgi:hypothetical protein